MINKLLLHNRTHSTDISHPAEESGDFSDFLQMGQQLLERKKCTTRIPIPKRNPLILQTKINTLMDQEIVLMQCRLYTNLLQIENHDIILSELVIKRKQLMRNHHKCYIIILGSDVILFFMTEEKQKRWYSYLKQYCIQTNLLMKYRLQEQIFQDYFTVVKKKNRQLYSGQIISKQQPFIKSMLAQIHLLKHPLILPIKGVFEDTNNYMLITDYFDGEPLFTYLVNGVRLQEIQLATLIYQLLLNLKYLSDQNTYHGHITPMNILIDRQSSNLEMAVIGFFNHPFKTGEITQQYINSLENGFVWPGLFNGELPGIASDLYQLGIFLYIITFYKKQEIKKPDPYKIFEELMSNFKKQLKINQFVLDISMIEMNSIDQSEYSHIFSTSQIDLINKLLNNCKLSEAINHSWFINAKQKAKQNRKQKVGLPSLRTILEIREHGSEYDVLKKSQKFNFTSIQISIESDDYDSIDEIPQISQYLNHLPHIELAPAKSHHS